MPDEHQLPVKAYIGDSVYAELVDNFQIKLTTENGIKSEADIPACLKDVMKVDPSNTIFLEMYMIGALIDFVRARGIDI